MYRSHQNISSEYHARVVCCPQDQNTYTLAPSIWSSVLMAISGMGDALLYAYLPVKGEALGLSLVTIGVLLSINKFTRFFTNRWVAYISSRWGIKNILLVGVISSALTTFTYALSPVTWVWILIRIIWGMAYSALRFSTIQYAGSSYRKGSALGIARSIQDMGPLLAYWVGPLMLTTMGVKFTFTAWALLMVALLPIFCLLPVVRYHSQEIKPFSYKTPQWIDLWVFVSSFIVEGLLVVGISRLIDVNSTDTDNILIIASLYISFRRLLNVVMSPISGWLSDRFGFIKVFQTSCLLMVLAVGMIALNMTMIGIILSFIASAVNLTLVPIVAMDLTPNHRNFDVLTRLSTSRDIGSAFGSLLGLGLLSAFDTRLIFISLCLILISIWFKIRKLGYRHE